jgi:phosphatidylglycerol:prolipoprotein diacylglycerol transferase
MHPILFSIPLPGWTIPLFPALLSLAAIGVLLALFGYRKRATDLLVIGAAAAVGGAFAAFNFRGEVYTLSPLPVYSYGAMLCLSIIVGWYLTLGLASKDGLPREVMANCYFVTAVSALIGARLLYVVTNLDEFASFNDLFALRRGGLVAYGGFLGGFVGSWWFLRRHRIRLLPWADVAVPSLATGLVITRLGCYLYGCDFGKPLADSAPNWLKTAGTFPRWADGTVLEGSGSPAWIQHVNQRGLSSDTTASLPVHPTQLYEVAAGLLLLALVFAARKQQRFRGQVFLAFTAGYGALRFALEVLRDDLERGTFGPYLSEHVVLPGAALAFGLAFAFGPARSIAADTPRRVFQIAALLPAPALFFLLKPASFAQGTAVQLSTSQWIGLCTGVAAALVWGTLFEAAKKNPEAAMALGEGATDFDDDDDGDDEPDASERVAALESSKKPARGKPAPEGDDESDLDDGQRADDADLDAGSDEDAEENSDVRPVPKKKPAAKAPPKAAKVAPPPATKKKKQKQKKAPKSRA